MKNISKTPGLSKTNYLKNKIFNIVKNENPGVNTLKSLKAFTLVELIIVITILAILSTIGFVSFQSYTINTRDANRLTTISNIQKGLSLYQAKSIKLPNPDDSTTIYASGVIIGYEGIVGDTISSLIGISKTPLDPIRSENYIYYTNVNKDKSQVMGFMEGDEYKTLSFLNNKITYAGKDDRNPRVEGDKLGIILDSNKQRVTGSVVDLLLTNSGITYTSYFDNKDVFSGTGRNLFSNLYNRRADLLTNSTYASLDDSLVGYWDMETTTLSGSQLVLKDLSKRGNNGTLTGGLNIGKGNGKIGKSTQFIGIGDGITFTTASSMGINFGSGSRTISTWFQKSNSSSGNTLKNIAGFPNSSGTNGINFSLSHNFDKIFFYGWGSNNNGFSRDLVGDSLSDNVWYFGTVTYDSQNIKLYLNGNLVSSALNPNLNTSNSTFNIGTPNFGPSNRFSGLIDEVRVYNRALSDLEIQNLYNNVK